MESVSVILLVAVLFAQITLFALFLFEKRRNNQRNKAMLSYIDRVVEDGVSNCKGEVNGYLDAFSQKIDERFENRDKEADKRKEDLLQTVHNELTGIKNHVSEQLRGIMLDYTQAQEAANKINDFGASLANIFDYDPIRAIQKGRNKGAS